MITKAAHRGPSRTRTTSGSTASPGPAVWTALINDTINDKASATPYVYVLVNKVVPETLTLWNNGTVQYGGIRGQHGAPGADTTDGTYAVFEHVRFSEMKGTNPDGSTYDDPNVPYASYFNGGDALHGFIRATYGSPQSNGCVEMSYADAARSGRSPPSAPWSRSRGRTTARHRLRPTTTTDPPRDRPRRHDDHNHGPPPRRRPPRPRRRRADAGPLTGP